MASWETADMAASLPAAPLVITGAIEDAAIANKVTAHGWVQKTAYDYDTYNKGTRELAEAVEAQASAAAVGGDEVTDAVGGIRPGDWSSNAAVYQWSDEFGEVGPAFPDLEKQLFGSENHVKTGLRYENIAKLEVIQEGSIRINPIRSFKDAGLHPVMEINVQLAKYDVPTPIQQYILPAVFKGHDVVACAQTGSGKTAAFLVPILSKLMGKAKKLAAPRPNPANYDPTVDPTVRAEPLVLIVCPSRELATQIFDEARRFCYRSMLRPCVVYGGGPLREQIAQLGKGCDVLIGTPGRLVDFIGRPHLLTLKRLKYMVIDEADEMLQSDWETELKQIMSGGDQEEGNINYLMFSATFPKMARDLAKEHLAHDHVRVRVGRAGSSHLNIKQDVVFVEAHAKRQALFDLLMSAPPARTIIFVNSKRTADEIDDYLFNLDIPCTSIHSDRTQREREDSIRAFRNGKAPVLIATGVSARGLDIHNVMHVVNYDLPSPQYGGIEEYTHRIGRTGRIGNEGLATSFYNERDSDLAETLVKTLLETHQLIPDFLQDYIPEGFTAEGEGNPDLLKFEADSDNGEGDENGDTSADAGGGWGALDNSVPVAASGWGQPAAALAPAASAWGQPAEAPAPVSSGWGAPQSPPSQPVQPAQPVAPSGWGVTQAPLAQPVQPAQPVAAPSWGAPQAPPARTLQPDQPVASSGWGSAPAAPVPVSQAAPAKPVVAGGWGNPSGADAWGSANAGNTGNTGWGATSGGGW